MAITQVKALFRGVEYDLTYNEETRNYETQLSADSTSFHQPGGYFPATVTVITASGDSDTASGEKRAGLRLYVRERTNPTIVLQSPPEGFVTSAGFTVSFLARDEEGGSGVDPATARALLDGRETPCAISGGVITVPLENVPDGPHVVCVTVFDHDGNEGTGCAAYTVDTVPPVLELTAPDNHAVVDDLTVTIAGRVLDRTSPPVSVTVAGQPVDVTGGKFETTVPLAVGENRIPVTAADQAGLQTVREVYRIRMITDRTQADVEELKAILAARAPDQAAYYAANHRGAYNYTDLNRVGIAAAYLRDWLYAYGYNPKILDKTDWTRGDLPTPAQRSQYVAGVSSIRAQLPAGAPEPPEDLEHLDVDGANAIEAALVQTDALRPLLQRADFVCGEIFCGEF